MDSAAAPDIEALHQALAAAEAPAAAAEAEAARVTASASSAEAMIAHLKLEIEKLRRALCGWRSERKERLLAHLEDLEATAGEDELAAEAAAAKAAATVKALTRRKPSHKSFPEHLPRERVVIPAHAV
jgi:hypothetical protein